MKPIVFLFFLVLWCATAWTQTPDWAQNWHQWRGPQADGVAPLGNPPIKWDEETNVKWKVSIPGLGAATPIIWGDQVFILTAVEKPENLYQFLVISYDRKSGKVNWQKTATEQVPHEGHQAANTYASASPITDGKRLFASFGSRGIYCYDLKGNFKWERDLGDMETSFSHGEASSPALYGETLVVKWDHEGASFIIALDAETGKTKWKKDRDEATQWSSPLIVPGADRAQVIVTGASHMRSYNLATGDLIWKFGCPLPICPVPSPIAANGIVYFLGTDLRDNSMLYALPINSSGDITGEDNVTWQYKTGDPFFVSSALLYGELLYFLNERGVISCLDSKTGKAHIDKERLKGILPVHASPVGASDRIYLLDRKGRCQVFKKGEKLEILAKNKLDDLFSASPAIVGKELFLRGSKYLYCIAEATKDKN